MFYTWIISIFLNSTQFYRRKYSSRSSSLSSGINISIYLIIFIFIFGSRVTSKLAGIIFRFLGVLFCKLTYGFLASDLRVIGRSNFWFGGWSVLFFRRPLDWIISFTWIWWMFRWLELLFFRICLLVVWWLVGLDRWLFWLEHRGFRWKRGWHCS